MNLTSRERLLLTIAACILLPLLFLRFTLFPFLEYKEQLQKEKVKLEHEILQIQIKGKLYQRVKGSRLSSGQPFSGRVNRILTSLSLASFAEQSSRNTPKGEGIALRLQNITLFDATSLLARLEKMQPKISIESMDMQRSPSNEELLLVTLALSTGGR